MSCLLKLASLRATLRGMTVLMTLTGVGLAQDLQAGAAVDGGVGFGEQVSQQAQVGMVELPHFSQGLVDLHNAVQFEISWLDHHQHSIRCSESIDRQPAQGWGTVDEDDDHIGL